MKKNLIIVTAIITTLGLISVPVGYARATEQNWSKVVYPGVYIEDLEVSGKQLSELEELIKEKYVKPVLSKKIEIQANDKKYEIDYEKLQARYDAEAVAKEAFNYGKEENIVKRYMLIKSPVKKEFKLSFTYNPAPIDEIIEKIEKDHKKEAENAKISVTKGDIKITPEKTGMKLEKDKLKQDILSQINEELSQEVVKLNAPLVVVKPEITSEKLSSINSKISSFSTSFSTSSAGRINNIDLSTKSINGTLLMPGDTFSFNEAVGERTRERGYKEAGVIIGDKIESGLGGGICQVSSTLYNAMLKSNIKAVERRNHSLPLAYIGKGLDATVDWGNIDLKFKNTLDVPVYIEGYTENKNVYFNIYSNQDLTKKSYELVTEVTDTIQPTVKYIDDPKRNEGYTEVVKKASAGYKVKTYRKIFENGKLIKTELVSSDYYRAVNGEIIRGTKKVSK
ncbi:VanW family protein [Clostridium swellfunianum]|uniref:VanW family protein n=1 Tax=Clostridium swellfunianum TaxID=1367462 RepID=UPI00202EF3F5|nr:VanW family protein [Clostridium swellfunianum]MCM0649143.1 VanW family protein [Clostridium swellfunianum]